MLNSRFRQISLALLAGFIFLLVMSLPAAAQEGIDQEKLDQGARLYAENCAVCHGPDGKGRIGATLAKNWPSIRPDLAIQETIQNGVPGSPMPAWSASNGGPLSKLLNGTQVLPNLKKAEKLQPDSAAVLFGLVLLLHPVDVITAQSGVPGRGHDLENAAV